MAVDIEGRSIQVRLEHADAGLAEAWKGQAALIDSPDYLKPSAYYMHDPKVSGSILTFRTDLSLIILEEGWPSPHKRLGMGSKAVMDYRGGRVHVDVKPGDSFELPNIWKLRESDIHRERDDEF